jgi:hypothetical protein
MATALETALTTEINKITDTIRKAYALEKLAEFVAARAALTVAAGNDVVTYSFSGRSATRIDVNQFRKYVANLEAELSEMLYGQVSVIDGENILA